MQESPKNVFSHYSDGRERADHDKHDIKLYDRQRATVTGVKEVISFDNNEILLETLQGTLAFRGNNLHVKRLTLEKGEVDLEGEIGEMKYTESHGMKETGSFIGKLFR